MQTVELHDVVECHVTRGPEISLTCSRFQELGDHSNTVYKAAIALQEYALTRDLRPCDCLGADIKLE